MRIQLTILLLCLSAKSFALNLWPHIPFNIQGANLCEFSAAYSQTRAEYLQEMVYNAERLLYAGDFNPTQTLMMFNQMYQRNLVYARRGLGATLENTFKAYLDQYYRNLRPRVRQIDLRYTSGLAQIINTSIANDTLPSISLAQAGKIDAFAYGHYLFSPNCNGNIVVTMTLILRNGDTRTYMGQGPARTVMSQIASRLFEDFQRTQFPSTLKIGNKEITLLGGLNGSIDSVAYLEEAETICRTLGGRLPSTQEYKFLNSYGDWSGGITLGRRVWAMDYPYVFIPYFERSPRRPFSQVNPQPYYYICVK